MDEIAFENYFLNLSIQTSVTFAAGYFASTAIDTFAKKAGTCLNPSLHLPYKVCYNIDKVMWCYRYVVNAAQSHFTPDLLGYDNSFMRCVVFGPLFEEIIYRDLIQDSLLYSLPMMMGVNVNSASYLSLRVLASSALFAVSHVNYWEEETGVLPEFASGLVLGLAKEYFGLDATIAAHMISNLYCEIKNLIGRE